MPSVRKRQINSLRKRERMLVAGPWFKPVSIPKKMSAPEKGRMKKSTFAEMQKKNPKLFSVAIRRMGKVERESTRHKKGKGLPVSETQFSEWLDYRHSGTHKRRFKKKLPRRFAKTPYNIGINAIIELVDAKGRPSHILMLKRPASVPEAPGFYDFAAGLVRTGHKPLEMLKKKVRQETGIPVSRMTTIGQGFKPSKTGEAFALHLNEAVANYNMIHVIRVNLTPKEALASAKKAKKDAWSPSNFVVIDRNPKAIRQFIAKNKKVWIPEVLRLYARELALYPGKGRKRKQAKTNAQ